MGSCCKVTNDYSLTTPQNYILIRSADRIVIVLQKTKTTRLHAMPEVD